MKKLLFQNVQNLVSYFSTKLYGKMLSTLINSLALCNCDSLLTPP